METGRGTPALAWVRRQWPWNWEMWALSGLWTDCNLPQNQISRAYQSQAGFLMSLSKSLDTQMERQRPREGKRLAKVTQQ